MFICGFCGLEQTQENEFIEHSKLHEKKVEVFHVRLSVGFGGRKRVFGIYCAPTQQAVADALKPYELLGCRMESVARTEIIYGTPDEIIPRVSNW